jgi:hypothetical protein
MVKKLISLCEDNELFGCCFCNKSEKTFAFCDYYDQPNSPACKDCFLKEMQTIYRKYINVCELYKSLKNCVTNVDVYNDR